MWRAGGGALMPLDTPLLVSSVRAHERSPLERGWSRLRRGGTVWESEPLPHSRCSLCPRYAPHSRCSIRPRYSPHSPDILHLRPPRPSFGSHPFQPLFSTLYPPLSILSPLSSILYPLSSSPPPLTSATISSRRSIGKARLRRRKGMRLMSAAHWRKCSRMPAGPVMAGAQ